MSLQLDIAWKCGKTIAKHLFTCVSKLANGKGESYIWGDNLRALCVWIDMNIYMEMSVGSKQRHIVGECFLCHFTRQSSMETAESWFPCWTPRETTREIFNNMWICFLIRWLHFYPRLVGAFEYLAQEH